MRLAKTFLLLAIFSTQVSGQSIRFLGVRSHYGVIIPHSPELEPISQTNPFGFQADISWMKTDDNAWKTCNCYGRTGISFAFFDYANNDQLGRSYNLIYFAEPYFKYQGAFKVSLRSGLGATYLDQVYDEETNPENLFYSAPISFYLLLGVNLNYHLNEKLAISLSGNYNHISNGGQRQPNKGINFPTISIGVDRVFNYQPLAKKPDELKSYDPATQFYLSSFGSLRSADEETQGSNHLRAGLLFGVMKPLSTISGLSGGFEVSYDGSYRFNISDQGLNESPIVSALLLGHRFKFGKVYFFTHYGFYTSRPRTLQPNRTFQNYALLYQFKGQLMFGTGLIAYGKVADHMDMRFAWLF